MLKLLKYVSVAAALTVASPVNALTLTGLSVSISSPFGSCSGVTVSSAAECIISDQGRGRDSVDSITVDVNETSIDLDFSEASGALINFFDWDGVQGNNSSVFDIVISGLTGFTYTGGTLTSFAFSSGGLAVDASVADQLTVQFNDYQSICFSGACGTATLNGTVAAVPLPTSLSFLVLGLGAVAFVGRRRKTAAKAADETLAAA